MALSPGFPHDVLKCPELSRLVPCLVSSIELIQGKLEPKCVLRIATADGKGCGDFPQIRNARGKRNVRLTDRRVRKSLMRRRLQGFSSSSGNKLKT